jgi:hypothetical protein
MKYLGIQYTVKVGTERGRWTWEAQFPNKARVGSSPSRDAAIRAAEKAIKARTYDERKRVPSA